MKSPTRFSRVPPAPQVISQLFANYKRATEGIALSFRDYLQVIGFSEKGSLVEGRDEGRQVEGPDLVAVPKIEIEGTLQIIVLLVDFDDNVGRRPARQFEDMLFSKGTYLTGSMREFYAEASQNKVDVIGTVHGWMRMPEPYTYYVNKKSGTGAYPNNAQRLAEHALAAAREQGVVFDQQLDKFGNKLITGLFIVHAGMGAEVMPSVSLQSKYIWSHKSDMHDLVSVTADLSAATYLTVPEDANMGVCAHELGHLAFQWDDFYDPNYGVDGQWEGAGNWDLMAGGSWNNSGNSPAHPAGLHKCQHHWLPIKEVSGSTHLVLPPMSGPNPIVARVKGRKFTPNAIARAGEPGAERVRCLLARRRFAGVAGRHRSAADQSGHACHAADPGRRPPRSRVAQPGQPGRHRRSISGQRQSHRTGRYGADLNLVSPQGVGHIPAQYPSRSRYRQR